MGTSEGSFQLSDRAYEALGSQIGTCELPPGSWLNERAASAALGMSRTPFRQALHRLSLEGLITIVPRLGARVSLIDLKDISDNLELRAAVEVASIRSALRKELPIDVATLRHLLSEMRGAIRDKNPPAFLEADQHFHLALAGSAQNRRALEALTRAWVHINRPRYLEPPSLTAMREGLKQHTRIVDSLERGDADQVEPAITGHIRSSAELFGDLSRRMPEAFSESVG